jgi:hypothetical protein
LNDSTISGLRTHALNRHTLLRIGEDELYLEEKTMAPQKLFDEYVVLSVEAQRQVADFIAFLQQRYVANQITQTTFHRDVA